MLEPFVITHQQLQELDRETFAKYRDTVYDQFKDELHQLWKRGYCHAVIMDGRIIEISISPTLSPSTMAMIEQQYPNKSYYVFSSPTLIPDLEKAEEVPQTPEDWIGASSTKAGILERIFYLQKKYDDRVSSNFIDFKGRYRSESEMRISMKMTALIHEAVELQRLTNWKWWKEPKPFDVEEARVELIDIWHFLVSASIDLGLEPKDILAIYEKKNAENHARQDKGY